MTKDASEVLVVDDDESIRSLIEMALTDEGYRVATAKNGADALAALREVAPALVLLDMRMPVMDGWAFAREYRRQPTNHLAPIVVLTAAADAAAFAREIGANGYLPKPFRLESLLDLVARFVRSG